MAIQQRKQTSIILTFRILQFVKQLRRRVKPRVLDGSIDASNLGNRIFPGLRRISKGLSRRDAKQSRRVANRICKARQRNPKSSRSSSRPGSVAPASQNVASHEVQHVLSSVDTSLRPAGSVFSTIAGNNKLFLKHNNAPIYEGCSMDETIELLVAVYDAINVLSECRLLYSDDWLVAQGLAVGLSIDENFVANYEHMLLELQTALIEALARKALEELLRGGQNKKQRKLLSWFTEFAEKPQPLSSSFPWTIKPSLAVLWGVCWMFYGSPDSQSTGGGNDRVPLDRVLQNLDLQWDTGASSEYVNLGRELIGEQPQHVAHATNVDVGLDNDLYEARNTDTWESDLTSDRLTSRLPSVVVSHAAANGSRAEPSPHHPDQDTYYRHVALDFPPRTPNNFYLPQEAAQPLSAFPLRTDHPQNPWHHHPYTSLPQDANHLITSAGQDPRGVRVSEPSQSSFFAPPQGVFASSNIYHHQVRQPEASPLYLNNTFGFYTHQQDIMTSEMVPNTMQVPHEHKRTTSINSNTDMPTPVSIPGHRSPMTSPTADEATQMLTSPRSQTHSNTHSRGISVVSSQDGDDDGSLRKNHSYKRAEEPPRNQDGKMACKYQECRGLAFDRKCEWSKHMDKHDRPYKCLVPGCEKLQGFTYSGGLLRHEREVHKMHGGTKKSLFCPFHDCKRSSGAGFTRKENLAEHVRRVHRRTSMSADMHGLVIRRDTTMERSPLPEERGGGSLSVSTSPYTRAIDFQERDEDVGVKRKRGTSDSGAFADRGNEEMRSEIKRLRQENEEKDERLRQLEQAVMALQQSARR